MVLVVIHFIVLGANVQILWSGKAFVSIWFQVSDLVIAETPSFTKNRSR